MPKLSQQPKDRLLELEERRMRLVEELKVCRREINSVWREITREARRENIKVQVEYVEQEAK